MVQWNRLVGISGGFSGSGGSDFGAGTDLRGVGVSTTEVSVIYAVAEVGGVIPRFSMRHLIWGLKKSDSEYTTFPFAAMVPGTFPEFFNRFIVG